jgi:hypothetical protein
LLQLNTVSLNQKRPRKAGLDRDFILGDFDSRQHDHFIDRLIEIKTTVLRRRFVEVAAGLVDDDSGLMGITLTTSQRFLARAKSIDLITTL